MARLRVSPGQVRLLALLCLIMARASAGWTEDDADHAKLLQQQLAALRAQGLPTTIAEARPAPVPDDQNAALMYMKLFDVSFEAEASRANADRGLLRYELPANFTISLAGALAARPLLESAPVQQALQKLREASLKPYCVFPIHWEQGFEAAFPHLAQFRQADRLVVAKALLEDYDGHLPQALDWLRVSYRIAAQVSQEPSLISQLVCYALCGITHRAATQIVCSSELSEKLAQPLFAELGRIDLQPGWKAAMRMELANGLEVHAKARQNPMAAPGQLRQAGVGASASARAAKAFWNLQEAIYARVMAAAVKASSLPYRLAIRDPALQPKPTDAGTSIAAAVMPAYRRAILKRDECLAQLGLLQTCLALKVYQHEQGNYPGFLTDLTWKVPPDPLSGKSFVYQRQGLGFKLYSVGPNLLDDGGQSVKPSDIMQQGDMVIVCDQ